VSGRQIRLLEREAMIAKDIVTDGFIVTNSMRQISTLAHIDAVTLNKLVPSSPSASDLNNWRMALNRELERGVRCCERLAPNHSRSCEIDAESAWIGLVNVKFRNLRGRG